MKARIWFPIAVVALAGFVVVREAVPPSPSTGKMDLNAFGQIPVQYQGRYMPIDTVARHHMLVISVGKETYATAKEKDPNRKMEPAIRWLLEVMSGKLDPTTKEPTAFGYEVIRIDSPDVRQFLKLSNRPGWWRYSFKEVAEAFDNRQEDVQKIVMKVRHDQPLTDAERAIMNTRGQLTTIVSIQRLMLPGIIPDPDNPGIWLSPHEVDERNQPQFERQAEREAEEAVNRRLWEKPEEMEKMRRQYGEEKFDAIVEQVKKEAAQKRLRELVDEHRTDFAPQSAAFHRILDAYEAGKADDFNTAVREYHQAYVGPLQGTDAGRTNLEYFLNRFDPFFLCQWMYVGVMVLAALWWLSGARSMNSSATVLGFFALAVHTLALVLRIIVSEKPPVTNLYSSAVFIGWAGLILCLALDLYYRNGLGNFTGGLIGMGTMLIARFLESNGDTMPRVEAVLNTNFWLSSHVTCVTLGYMTTFVAGHIAAYYIVAGFFSKSLAGDRGRTVYGMIYGVTCFATLLSFVGTVLGGFWADDSWGRFWGWDPKENGAVLVVIWNVINLHLRWAGLVKARGFAIVAVLGNVVTAWSWFGTNQLGIGLHAYGFDDKLATGCAVYWLSQFLIVGLALVPLRFWASFAPTTATK